ncbi:putative Zinc finger BED domain-containing protein 4 [Daphnia magna]|uniref:Putative Zinc finger BED domain-containing protein 4 n=1 Tax=Daphnia magna TaxID=35525 RepID=A0A164Q270_9CRUS|nr:putative Zinc finger BED domain-containing protein 4 [Daphnia magna]
MPNSRKNQLDVGLTRVVSEGNLPLNILANSTVREWIEMAVPGYHLPSVYVMRNTLIPQRYEQIKEYIKKKLSSCTDISIILDIWSCKSMVGYIGFTCSGVLKTHEPFRLVSQRPRKITTDLSCQIVRVVTDGGSNMIRPFNIQFPTNQSETLIQSSVEQVECSEPDPNPLIHIPDSERMSAVVDAMDKALSIIGAVRRSVNDNEIVYYATKLHLPAKNATRWNSQYYAIKGLLRIYEIDPLIQTKLNATQDKSHCLTSRMIAILKELVLILEPFQEATDDLQADYELLGNVIPAYLDLINKVSLTREEDDGTVIKNPKSPLAGKIHHCTDLAEALKKSLESRMSFVLQDTFYVLGAILDPRFKKCWISTTAMSEYALLDSVRFELTYRYSNLKDGENASRSQGNEEEGATNKKSGPTPSKKKPNLYSTINATERPPSAGSSQILEEFEVYLNEKTIPMQQEDISGVVTPTRSLKYWSQNAHRFPYLSCVARNIYGCPVSSVSIERVSSTASDILTAKRMRTKAGLFEKLHFLKHNSKLINNPVESH